MCGSYLFECGGKPFTITRKWHLVHEAHSVCHILNHVRECIGFHCKFIGKMHKFTVIDWIRSSHLLRMPLSDIITYSCLAAWYPGFILLIFGFTPTFEPPMNTIIEQLNNCFQNGPGETWKGQCHIPINSRASIIGYSFISCSTTLIAGSDLFSMQNKSSYWKWIKWYYIQCAFM